MSGPNPSPTEWRLIVGAGRHQRIYVVLSRPDNPMGRTWVAQVERERASVATLPAIVASLFGRPAKRARVLCDVPGLDPSAYATKFAAIRALKEHLSSTGVLQ